MSTFVNCWNETVLPINSIAFRKKKKQKEKPTTSQWQCVRHGVSCSRVAMPMTGLHCEIPFHHCQVRVPWTTVGESNTRTLYLHCVCRCVRYALTPCANAPHMRAMRGCNTDTNIVKPNTTDDRRMGEWANRALRLIPLSTVEWLMDFCARTSKTDGSESWPEGQKWSWCRQLMSADNYGNGATAKTLFGRCI